MGKLNISNVLVLILGIFMVSCESDSPNNNNQSSNVITSISGTVNSLPANAKIIKAVISKDSLKYIAGNDTAASSNSFNISLSPPPDNVLKNLTELFSFIPVEDKGSSAAMGNFIFNQTYETGASNYNGTIMKSNRFIVSGILETGDFSISYLYCNTNETFSGNYLSVLNSDTLKYNVTLNLEIGYNPVTYKVKTKRTNFTEFDITSGETSGGNWYYYGLVNDNQQVFKYD